MGNFKFKDYEQARNAALAWLEEHGFTAEYANPGRLFTEGMPVGMRCLNSDGKVIGFRVEYDPDHGAHINVFGKEKGPHFLFEATERTVRKIKRRFSTKPLKTWEELKETRK